MPPRWEWTPERVSPDRDLDWYDWILTRGGPQRLRNAREFERALSYYGEDYFLQVLRGPETRILYLERYWLTETP